MRPFEDVGEELALLSPIEPPSLLVEALRSRNQTAAGNKGYWGRFSKTSFATGSAENTFGQPA
jgi:hypothetical protein